MDEDEFAGMTAAGRRLKIAEDRLRAALPGGPVRVAVAHIKAFMLAKVPEVKTAGRLEITRTAMVNLGFTPRPVLCRRDMATVSTYYRIDRKAPWAIWTGEGFSLQEAKAGRPMEGEGFADRIAETIAPVVADAVAAKIDAIVERHIARFMAGQAGAAIVEEF